MYAAKIINIDEKYDGHEEMLFLRESLIMYKLDHPSIVKFVGSNFKSFRDPSIFEPTIITEYLEHGSLKDNLNKEKRSISDSEWTPTKKYISLIGISDAMRYLHEHGIVHQDLKPENILVDNLYYPRVCDFGLSRCFSESFSKSLKLTMTGEKGTPLYMAPELLRGDEHYDPSVDVYAFSILTYEIVSNKEPYFELGEKVTPYTFMDKVIKGYRPKRVPGITDKMWNLLCRCWSGEAKERPTFEYIFNELSKDRSYFSEFFDEKEFNEYLDVLKESCEKDMKKSSSLSKEADGLIQKLKEENDKFKKKNDENEATIEKLKKEVRSLKSKVKDYKKEHESLSSSDSNVYSGLLSLLGQKSMRDYKDAIHQLSRSSTKGNRYSSFILGLLYEIGENTWHRKQIINQGRLVIK